MTDALHDTTWTLVGPLLAPTGVDVVMSFGNGSVSGFSGCNRFSGSYRLTVDALEFGPLVSTRMACPPESMAIEDEVQRRLAQVVTAMVDPTELTLLDADGELLLRFEAQGAGGLTGDWVVTGIHYPDRQAIISTRGVLTVSFDADQISGDAGCNRFEGPLAVIDTAMNVGPLVTGGTICEDGDADGGPTLMEQEQALLKALEGAVGFRLEGRRLTLWRGDGGIGVSLQRD